MVARGPAGLSAAISAAENGLDVCVFDKAANWRSDAQLVRKYIDKSADTIDWLEDMGVEFYDAAKYFAGSESTWHRVKPDTGVPGPRAAAKMYTLMAERAKELGQDLHLTKVPGLCGEGIRMAWEAGAGHAEMNYEMTYGMPLTKNDCPKLHRIFCQPNLMVNLNGERFINEAIMDNTTFTGNAIDLQRGHCAFSILDSSIIKHYERNGLDCVSLVYPIMEVKGFAELFETERKNGNTDLYYGETLEELCANTGIHLFIRLTRLAALSPYKAEHTLIKYFSCARTRDLSLNFTFFPINSFRAGS